MITNTNLIYLDFGNELQSYYNFQKSNFKFRHHYSINDCLDTILNKNTIKNYCLNWTPDNIRHDFDEIRKITVITLIYNCQDFNWLEQSIRSSLWQITKWDLDIQLLFIIDPPWDKENEYLLKLQEKYFDYCRFQWVFNGNRKGYAGCYNQALELCEGDYIFILDCDDISHPERLYWSISILEKYPELMGISFTPLCFCNNEDYLDTIRIELGSPYNLNSTYYTLLDATLLRELSQRPFLRINPQTLCFRKAVADNIRIPKELCDIDSQIPQMDRIFLYHCLLKYPLGFMQDARLMLFSRIHDNQTCKLKYESLKNAQLEIYHKKTLSDKLIENIDGNTLNQIFMLKNKELRKAGILKRIRFLV